MNRTVITLFILLILSLGVALVIFPFAGEFHDFYSAGRAVLEGQSPYTVQRYYNPICVVRPKSWTDD